MRQLFLLWLLILLAACTPTHTAPEDTIPLPTLYPTPTATIDLEAALRIGVAYLDSWQRQDFDTMYSLLSFNSQELISPDAFTDLYSTSQNRMTFEALTFAGRTASRMGSRTVQMVYDVTFQTRILGEFTDTNRFLTIILDARANDWRIAWSAGDIFAEMANGARLEFEPQVPSRANIYDRNGVVIADMNGTVVEVEVVQRRAPDWERCRALLIETIDTTPERIDGIFNRVPPDWLMVAGTIERSTYRERSTELEETCNASFKAVPIRRYLPTGSLMPHILGHISYPTEAELDEIIRRGFNAETMVGQAGVERSWNDVLSGTPGGRLSIIAADGSRVRTLASAPSQSAESIWLTIDSRLQEYLLTALNEAYAQNATGWGETSDGASAIVLDVNTGEILAMASYPVYDNNALTPYPAIGRSVADEIIDDINSDERRPMLNRPTQGTYPAGSIFKVIDSIAILDTGLYDADTDYYCGGTWVYKDDTRFDWWANGHGRVTTRTALMQSCNPFFYEAGFRLNNLDPTLLPSYARRMGLGAVTGLTALSEASGQIPDPDIVRVNYGRQWTYSDAVNLAIGQGEIQVTPLQIVRMYAGIANGGLLMQPHLVREHGILDERTFVAEPDISSTFDVMPEALDLVRQGLCDVTTSRSGTTGGTAWHIFNLPQESPLMEIGVCGKTGTAQTGRPEPEHSWFAAYAPARAPEIAVVVMVENSGDGSAVAAPITKRILEYYFFLMED